MKRWDSAPASQIEVGDIVDYNGVTDVVTSNIEYKDRFQTVPTLGHRALVLKDNKPIVVSPSTLIEVYR